MSFILDALRKSDQQRQRSAAPTLTTAQSAITETRKPPLLWYGLIATVLVGAGVLIGWLQRIPPQQAASASVASPAVMPTERARETPVFAPAPFPAAPEIQRQAEPQLAKNSSLPAPAPGAEDRKTRAPLEPAPSVPAVVPLPAREAAAPKLPEVSAQSDALLSSPAELPPAIQQELPKLSILAHSYSNKPKARFVFINDQMVHEEEYPAPGLKLEQITPDGMIFSYKGYRFRRTANAENR